LPTAERKLVPPVRPPAPVIPLPPSLEEVPFPAWIPGRLHIVGPVAVPGFLARSVRIYLPSSFDPAVPTPAVYAFDGQNAFGDEASYAGGWHLDRTVERRVQKRRLAPIVVGIDHGGADRIHELSPFPFEHSGGRLEPFLSWVTLALMPRLRRELPLLAVPEGSIVAGSSMGGLAALYAHLRHPRAFGGALVMSPSFWVADGAILPWAERVEPPNPSRIYLDAGRGEGNGELAPIVRAMAGILRAHGYRRDRLRLRIDPNGGHDEPSWRRRLPGALRFFLGG
jgi:enterochelin esterase-like enzyme